MNSFSDGQIRPSNPARKTSRKRADLLAELDFLRQINLHHITDKKNLELLLIQEKEKNRLECEKLYREWREIAKEIITANDCALFHIRRAVAQEYQNNLLRETFSLPPAEREQPFSVSKERLQSFGFIYHTLAKN